MLEFVTWFIWLTLCALLQHRLCRSYPGIRTVSRNTFVGTVLIAVLPGVWILFRTPHNAHLLLLLNHYFGIGIYAQTSLRALLQLHWLALAPISLGLTSANVAPLLHKERRLVAIMTSLPQALGRGKTQDPSPRE